MRNKANFVQLLSLHDSTPDVKRRIGAFRGPGMVHIAGASRECRKVLKSDEWGGGVVASRGGIAQGWLQDIAILINELL
jgi:hypothetical protein